MIEKWDIEIGKKALALGWININQLKSCLECQRKSKEKGETISIADILLRQKYITLLQLEALKRTDESVASALGWKTGDIFEGYQIQEKLGAGGMGIVYKACEMKLKRVVALKLLLSLDVTPQESKRFMQEASVMANFNHPNIVRLFEVKDAPKHYFTMEYIEGDTLSHSIKEKQINPILAAQIIEKITDALDEVHKMGVIHRDIKPANIMISRDGTPKLMDFGLAKVSNVENSISQTGNVVGTPAYMSPEQSEGKNLDRRADIYSLGATMYECLTGRPPFQGDSYAKIVLQILYEDVVPPRVLNPDIPAELEAITLKCLEKKAHKRYINARQLKKDIQSFLANRPIIAKKYTQVEKLKRLVSRHKIASGLLISFISCIIIFIMTLLHYNQKVIREKAESEKLANAVIESLEYAYCKHQDLQQDQEFLKPVRSIFEHLQRLNSEEKYLILRGLVFGISKKQQEAQKGIEDYNRLIQKNPNDALAYSNRGTLYERMEKYQEALRDFTHAIHLNHKNSTAYNNRGVLYEKLGKYQEAVEDYCKAIDLTPDNAQAYYNRGVAYYKLQRHQEAFQDFSQAILLDPKEIKAYYSRGIMHAIEDYSRVISFDNKYLDAYYNRGTSYENLNKYQEAIDDYSRVISLNPKHSMAYNSRGSALYKLNKYQEAVDDYSRAIALDSSYYIAFYNRGSAYAHLKKYTESIADWQKAIELGHPEKAMLERLIKKAKENANR